MFGLYVDVVTKLNFKDVAVQRNVPSFLHPLKCSPELPSDRSIEVSRPARILDTIDCRHPASRTTARGSFNHFLLFLVRAGLTNLSVLAFELNVCELSLFLLPPHIRAFSSLSIFLPHIRTRSPLLSFPSSLLSLSSSFLFLLYQAEGGSGHERAATLLLDSDAVTGAEVRRISIGFEPDTGGRPKTP